MFSDQFEPIRKRNRGAEESEPQEPRGRSKRDWATLDIAEKFPVSKVPYSWDKLRETFPTAGFLDRRLATTFLNSNKHILTAVSYAEILDRISQGFSSNSRAACDNRQAVAVHALKDFLHGGAKPAPRELATIARAIGRLEVRDDDAIPLLARRAKRVLPYSSPLDLAFFIRGFGPYDQRLSSHDVRTTLTATCDAFKQGIESGGIRDATDWVHFLSVMSNQRIVHHELTSAVLQAIGTSGEQDYTPFKGLSLGDKFEFLAVCCHYGVSLDDMHSIALSELESLATSGDWEKAGLSAQGFGKYALLACVTRRHISSEAFRKLERQFNREAGAISDPRAREVILRLVPAIILTSPEPQVETHKLLKESKQPEGSATNASLLEHEVATILYRKLDLRFQSEPCYAPYRLDFLIECPGGSRINLEADGDEVHLLYDVQHDSLIERYPLAQIVQDKFMRLCYGIPVTRVLGSELQQASNKTRLIREKLEQAGANFGRYRDVL